MKKIQISIAIAVAAMSIITTSCKKSDNSNDTIASDKISAMQDDAQASDLMDDVDNEADDVTNGNNTLKSAFSDTTGLSGRVVEWTVNNDGTKTAVITYTNFTNPKAKNERVKNGVITIVVTGKRSDNTYKRVVTFTNFTINGIKIEGTKTIEKVSALKYQITLVGGKITFTDSTYITCDYTRTRTMVEGADTPLYIWDDAYTIEGSATGLTRKNVAYTKEITIPIKFYTAYRFPVSGSFTITTDKNTLTLDYGDGTMDDIATLTVNGYTKQITLRK